LDNRWNKRKQRVSQEKNAGGNPVKGQKKPPQKVEPEQKRKGAKPGKTDRGEGGGLKRTAQ